MQKPKAEAWKENGHGRTPRRKRVVGSRLGDEQGNSPSLCEGHCPDNLGDDARFLLSFWFCIHKNDLLLEKDELNLFLEPQRGELKMPGLSRMPTGPFGLQKDWKVGSKVFSMVQSC